MNVAKCSSPYIPVRLAAIQYTHTNKQRSLAQHTIVANVNNNNDLYCCTISTLHTCDVFLTVTIAFVLNGSNEQVGGAYTVCACGSKQKETIIHR